MILKFDNKSAYDSAEKSTTESTVALVQDGKGIEYNSVNIIADVPEIGDKLFLDANNNWHFLKHDTYVAASFPSGCTFVGVVFDVQGNTAKICHKISSSQKWADVFQWKITGWLLDSTDHACAVTLYTNTAIGTFTYNAATLSDCATQLNMWLAANASNYTCYIDASGNVLLQWNAYIDYTYTHTIAGLTLTPSMADEISASYELTRKSKGRLYWGVCNYNRYMEVYANNTANKPTEMVKDTTNITVGRETFNTNDFMADMRAKYGTYENYVKSMMIINPYPRGILDGSTGQQNTLALAAVTYTAKDGTSQYKYPAARYCNQIAYNNSDLAQGKWYLPSISEVARLFEQETYGLSGVTIANADAINKSLNEIGGTLHSVSSNRWSCSRSSSSYAWLCYGAGYVVSYGIFSYAFLAVPVLALKFNS